MAAGSGAKKLDKGDILFREGDASDAMYVIKSGNIAITKAKGNGEIVLAELGPGQMLGEMAFFDNKPRSAGARAAAESEVIILPFKALHAQFKTFPEWLKAMVKTVNSHLRNANQRIKNLEQAQKEEGLFSPYTVTKLTAILSFVTHKYGEKVPEGLVVPTGVLRKFTIQVFQEPTNKMQSIMAVYESLGLLKLEDLGEGRQKLTVLKLDVLSNFVEFYNDYLFKEESKRVTVEEGELKILKAILFYGKQQKPDDKGVVKVSLTDIQNSSMKDLEYLVKIEDTFKLSEKGLIGEKMQGPNGISTSFNFKDLDTVYPYWNIIHTLQKIKK